MAYTVKNFRTKKALKEALQNGPVEVYQPGLGTIPVNGVVHIEGPHYPEHHTWGGDGTIKNGRLVSIK